MSEGADLRALAVRAGDGRLKIFEVDEPPTQEAKVQALRDAGVAYDHVTFAPTDFNQQSWVDSLTDHGFDPTLPTFILWEGVTMYLDDAAVDEDTGRRSRDSRPVRASPSTSSAGNSCSAESPTP